MSKLEKEAQRVLTPILSGVSEVTSLQGEDAFPTSRWIATKAVCCLRAVQEPLIFSATIYSVLRLGGIPNGFTIEVRRLKSVHLNFVCHPFGVVRANEIERTEINEVARSSCIVGFQFGTLGFRLSFVPPHPVIRRVQVGLRPTVLYPRSRLHFKDIEDRSAFERTDVLELPIFCASLGLFADVRAS